MNLQLSEQIRTLVLWLCYPWDTSHCEWAFEWVPVLVVDAASIPGSPLWTQDVHAASDVFQA